MTTPTIQIVESTDDFDRLRPHWEQLVSEQRNPSIFSTYDYVRTAWEYSREDDQRLFILVVKNGDKTIGIAPFRITRDNFWGVRARVIRFIAEWEGNQPGIITLDESPVWKMISGLLSNNFKEWDLISLMEQPVASSAFRNSFQGSRYYYEEKTETRNFAISLDLGWEEYLKKIPRGVKKNWRRRRNNLFKQFGDIEVDIIQQPEQVDSAIERFLAIEQSGWKKDAHIGVGKDDIHKKFYTDLICNFSEKDMASFVFLKADGKDLAGDILFRYRNTIYDRHTAYDPEYAKYSPGIYLLTEIVKHFQNQGYDEMDLQGMSPDDPKKYHSKEWSTRMEDTKRQIVYRRNGRLAPLIVAKQLKNTLLTRKTH